MQRLIPIPVIIDHGVAGKRSSLLRNIKAGLFPEGILIGRSLMWPEYEVEALQRARIRGDSDDQIRTLVADLMAKRKTLSVMS